MSSWLKGGESLLRRAERKLDVTRLGVASDALLKMRLV